MLKLIGSGSNIGFDEITCLFGGSQGKSFRFSMNDKSMNLSETVYPIGSKPVSEIIITFSSKLEPNQWRTAFKSVLHNKFLTLTAPTKNDFEVTLQAITHEKSIAAKKVLSRWEWQLEQMIFATKENPVMRHVILLGRQILRRVELPQSQQENAPQKPKQKAGWLNEAYNFRFRELRKLPDGQCCMFSDGNDELNITMELTKMRVHFKFHDEYPVHQYYDVLFHLPPGVILNLDDTVEMLHLVNANVNKITIDGSNFHLILDASSNEENERPREIERDDREKISELFVSCFKTIPKDNDHAKKIFSVAAAIWSRLK